MKLTFNQLVRVHSLILEAPETDRSTGPASVRLFVNEPNADFEAAESERPVQELTLTDEHRAGKPLELRCDVACVRVLAC
jgi:hypothetical protein